MLFHSFQFILVFLPVVLAGFFWLGPRTPRLAALWLAVASLVFYAANDVAMLLPLAASIVLNYATGYFIGKRRGRHDLANARIGLIAGVLFNLALLGYFKYANFFLDSANALFGSAQPLLELALPLGISFFTFTQIAFLVDVHRGVASEYDFVHYVLFVTYFPHLLAGPLLHHKQMMPQLAQTATYRLNWNNVTAGLSIFTLGMAKKVLLADDLANYVNPLFGLLVTGAKPHLIEAWTAILAFSLQLYFDFSGYTDMAIGLSLMFNIHLPINFNSPLKAASIIEFWQRWHITLTRFFQDYLFIPMAFGGKRFRRLRLFGALVATILLMGLWHGASWNFVLWGALQAIYLLANRAWRSWPRRMHLPHPLAVLFTYLAVTVSLPLFRAADLSDAASLFMGLAGMNGVSLSPDLKPVADVLAMVFPAGAIRFDGFFPLTNTVALTCLVKLAACFAIACLMPNMLQLTLASQANREYLAAPQRPQWLADILAWRQTPLQAIGYGCLFGFTVMSLTHVDEFIYFRF